jgi:hypothetical protein
MPLIYLPNGRVATPEGELFTISFVRFESRFKVRADGEHLCQPTRPELVHYLFGQVAELEDAIRFAQSSPQDDQHRDEGSREPKDFRVVKVDDDECMVVPIDKTEKVFPDIPTGISACQKAFGTPETHDGSSVYQSDLNLT